MIFMGFVQTGAPYAETEKGVHLFYEGKYQKFYVRVDYFDHERYVGRIERTWDEKTVPYAMPSLTAAELIELYVWIANSIRSREHVRSRMSETIRDKWPKINQEITEVLYGHFMEKE